MIFIPFHFQQLPDQLKLKQKVNARIIAPIYQSLHHPLNSPVSALLQQPARPPQTHQVHIERQLQRRNMSLLLRRTSPVYQPMRDVQKVEDVLRSGTLRVTHCMVEEGDQELGFE